MVRLLRLLSLRDLPTLLALLALVVAGACSPSLAGGRVFEEVEVGSGEEPAPDAARAGCVAPLATEAARRPALPRQGGARRAAREQRVHGRAQLPAARAAHRYLTRRLRC
jgi:hypothetical protein